MMDQLLKYTMSGQGYMTLPEITHTARRFRSNAERQPEHEAATARWKDLLITVKSTRQTIRGLIQRGLIDVREGRNSGPTSFRWREG